MTTHSAQKEQRLRVMKTGVVGTIYIGIVAGAVVLANLVSGFVFTRADLTNDQRYTLSDSSARLAADLEEPLAVYAFISGELPAPYNTIEREVGDLLAEYQAASNGKFRFTIIDPGQSEADQERAANFGIQPVTIGEQSRDELSFREVFVGLAMVYEAPDGDRTDIVEQLFPGMNYEYELTRRMRDLVSTEDKPRLGFVINDGSFLSQIIEQATQQSNPMQGGPDPEQVKEELAGQLESQLFDELFDVTFVDLAESVGDEVRGLVLLGPTREFSDEAKQNLDAFIMSGRGVAFFVSPYRAGENPMAMQLQMQGIPSPAITEPNEIGLDSMLQEYGVRLNRDTLIDRDAAQVSVSFHTVAYFGDQPIEQALPELDPRLPIIPDLNPESLLVPNIPLLAFQPADRRSPLPISSLSLTPEALEARDAGTLHIVEVARTAESAVRRTDAMVLSLDQALSPDPSEVAGPFPVAVTVEGPIHSAFGDQTATEGRILVASNGDFITNVFNRNDPLRDPRVLRSMPGPVTQSIQQYSISSILFLKNTADWLVSDHDLISIRGRGMPEFIDVASLKEGQKTFYQVANIAGIPVGFALIGLGAMFQRRSRRRALTEAFRTKTA